MSAPAAPERPRQPAPFDRHGEGLRNADAAQIERDANEHVRSETSLALRVINAPIGIDMPRMPDHFGGEHRFARSGYAKDFERLPAQPVVNRRTRSRRATWSGTSAEVLEWPASAARRVATRIRILPGRTAIRLLGDVVNKTGQVAKKSILDHRTL